MTYKRSKIIFWFSCSAYLLSGCVRSHHETLFVSKKIEAGILALSNVSVIPMTKEIVIPNQTVIIRDRKIASIDHSDRISLPESVRTLNCQGKYLVPGLADMHVHLNSGDDLILFLAHGVTTVQNMWGYQSKRLRWMGFPNQRILREKIHRGDLLGPAIFTSGPILEGEPLTQPFMRKIVNTDKAVQEVHEQKQKGYDFIKIYDYLNRSVYQAIISSAGEIQIPVKGHVPFDVGIDAALASGQSSIEHLTGYIDPDAAQFLIPEDSIDLYAKKTHDARVWNCPTIGVWQKLAPEEKIKEMKQHPGMQYLSFMQRFFLNMSIKAMKKSITYEGDYLTRMRNIDFRMTKALHDAGAKLLLGTDCGNPFVFPGWSAHEELLLLVDAGLTAYEALFSGTRNAAEHLNTLQESGTIEEGKQADLILLDQNPLDEIANIGSISGIVVRGMWSSKAELDDMLARL